LTRAQGGRGGRFVKSTRNPGGGSSSFSEVGAEVGTDRDPFRYHKKEKRESTERPAIPYIPPFGDGKRRILKQQLSSCPRTVRKGGIGGGK